MKSGFLITARLKSTRLKKKVLKKINNRPLISHMIERIKYFGKFDKIIICTSNLKQDAELIKIAKENHVDIYLGDKDDVAKRLFEAAKLHNIGYVVNIPADCPLVDVFHANKILKLLKSKKNIDLVRSYYLPIGLFSYGFKKKAMKKIINIKNSKNTEVWYPYFTKSGLFKVHDMKVDNKYINYDLRFTVDYKEDFEFIKKIFENFEGKKRFFTYDDILNLLKLKPNLKKINNKRISSSIKRLKTQSILNLKDEFKLINNKKNIYIDYDEWMEKYRTNKRLIKV